MNLARILCRLIIIITFSWCHSAIGQTTVKGQIVSNGVSLPGVSVAVLKTNIGTTSNEDGKFEIAGVPVGTFSLRFTYLGYDTLYKDVDFGTERDADLGKLNMRKTAREMKAVTVTGKYAEGSAQEAIMLTKKSTRIETVVSRENLQKLPDKNIAEAVQRVAGVKMERNKGEGSNVSLRGTPGDWTATLVNGDRLPTADEDNPTRTFEFEVFPSNLVDYIFVTRSITPDIEGDNIGGAINFQTIGPAEKKILKINAGGGQNLIAGKPLYDLNFVYGDISKNKKLSFSIAASDYTRPYGADAFQLVYGSPFNHGINKVELKDYFGERVTLGGNATLQYRPNDRLKIAAHIMAGKMDDDKYQYKLNYNYSDGSGQRIRMLGTHGVLQRRIYGGDITAEYQINPKLTINTKIASYQNSFQYGPFPYGNNSDYRNGYVTYDFISNSLLEFKDMVNTNFFGQIAKPGEQSGPIKLIGKDDPYGHGDNYKSIHPMPDIAVTAKDYHFYQVFSQYNHTIEKDPVVAQLNGIYKLNDKITIKAGIKGRYKEGSREQSLYQWIQQVGNPTIPTDPLPIQHFQLQDAPRNSSFLSEFGQAYENKLVPFLTPGQMGSLINRLGDTLRTYTMDKYNQDYRLWVGGHYQYAETTLAGYMMAEVNAGERWKLVGGLRVEETALHETGDSLNVDTLLTYIDPTGNYFSYYEPKKQILDRTYIAILPSLNADYTINKNSQLRLAASRTFHRPNFEETKPGAPIYYVDKQELYLGNTKLNPTYSLNFDATYQLFIGKKDLITFGGYYKYVTDHILSAITDADDAASLIILQYKNVKKSFIAGIEASADKHFDFLNGFWSGFGINANITYSYSQMQVPGRPKAQAMSEQTPLLYNIGVYYEKGRVSTKLALNYTGPYLMSPNLVSLKGVGLVHKDTDFDLYRGEMYSLDYMLSVKAFKHFTVYAEANNLLDSPYKTYIGQEWRPKRIEYYHQRVQVGLKFEL